jgi:hypothetical protein
MDGRRRAESSPTTSAGLVGELDAILRRAAALAAYVRAVERREPGWTAS